MTTRQARIDSNKQGRPKRLTRSKEGLKGRQEKTQTKTCMKKLQGRQEKTAGQANKKRLKGRQEKT